MPRVDYKKASPYSKTEQATWYLGVLNFRNIPRDPSDNYTVLQSRYANRPDLLSYDLYGTPDYWWTFMILNPDVLKDPIYDFVAGAVIYTAQSDRLSKLLGS